VTTPASPTRPGRDDWLKPAPADTMLTGMVTAVAVQQIAEPKREYPSAWYFSRPSRGPLASYL